MAYVYRHLRLDTETPFYIGIGKDEDGKYKRAYRKENRNRYWHNVVKKYGYEVEIMIDGLSWGNAMKKEIEFIKLYRRVEHGGILINLTDGGGGNMGYVTSEETKKKQSLLKIGKAPPNKGKKMTEEQRSKLVRKKTGKPSWNKGLSASPETVAKWKSTMSKRGFVSPMEGKSHTPEARARMSESQKGHIAWNKGKPISAEQFAKLTPFKKGQSAWNKGLLWTEEAKRQKSELMKGKPILQFAGRVRTAEEIAKIAASKMKKVYQFNLEWELVAEYRCSEDAANATGLKEGTIRPCCRNAMGDSKSNIHGGFLWSYKENKDIHLETYCK